MTITLIIKGQLVSGNYESGLNIAYNPISKNITGFFESYTGYDESTGNSRFSCVFYLNGFYYDSISEIQTYYPKWKEKDLIIGKIRILDSTKISILLPQEHGGCSNVWHFADGYSNFEIAKKRNWIEIRYIDCEKSFFYNENNESSIRKSYLVKGDVVYIDKIEGIWVHCEYSGKTTTKGWIKLETLNH